MKKILLIALGLLLIALEMQAKRLPAVKLKTLDGQTVGSNEISNDGKPVVIAFFALWCKPCLRELTAIADVYEQWQAETGVKLVAVSIDDSRSTDKVAAEVNARGFVWETLLDANSDFKRAMNINLIPHAIVLDGDGEIRWQHSSYTDGGEEEIIQAVRELIQE